VKRYRSMRSVLKYGMPAFLLMLPLISIYGWLNPWQPAEHAFLGGYAGQIPVMIGFSEHAQLSARGNILSRSRSYILFPSVLRDPKIVSVSQVGDYVPAVSESIGAIYFYLAWGVACIVATWWYWFRDEGSRPPNQAL